MNRSNILFFLQHNKRLRYYSSGSFVPFTDTIISEAFPVDDSFENKMLHNNTFALKYTMCLSVWNVYKAGNWILACAVPFRWYFLRDLGSG